MSFLRFILIGFVCIVLSACGEEAPGPQTEPEAQEAVEKVPTAEQQVPAEQSAGGVKVTILPDNPTATGCLSIMIQGNPGRSAVVWKINGEIVSSRFSSQLCSDHYKRGDRVTVEVGTKDQGAQASVAIANSPPKVIDISSTPDEIFAGRDVSVVPVAEDVDGDTVDFSYQWLINGDADPLLTEAILPGDKFTKGDTIQVQIVPNDFYDDGPTYESHSQLVPNAPPQITSQPPAGITSLDYRYQVAASDPDDSSFTYRLEEAPDGMTIDEQTGLIKWDLTDATPGMHTIAIIVSDPDGAEAAQEYTLTLKPGE